MLQIHSDQRVPTAGDPQVRFPGVRPPLRGRGRRRDARAAAPRLHDHHPHRQGQGEEIIVFISTRPQMPSFFSVVS